MLEEIARSQDEAWQEQKALGVRNAERNKKFGIKPLETNSTGAEINQISKENTQMNAAAPITINPSSGGEGGKTSNNTSNVSTVTYQNNNIPDRQYSWTMGAVNAL